MTTTKTLQRALGILFRSVTFSADVFRDATSNDEVDAQYIVHGTAKAWANLDGTGTIALRDSLNVASVVDNGTGNYTFNFGNNMTNANYAPTHISRSNLTDTSGPDNDLIATGSVNLRYYNSTVGFDANIAGIAIFGDLA